MTVLTREWVPAEDGHSLSLRCSDGSPSQPAILFVHGFASDGRFFLNSEGRGPAAFFLAKGYCVFLLDLRGHGKSRSPGRRPAWDWNFDAYARSDIPRAVRFVRERHTGPLFVLCHSFGGYAALAGLGLNPDLQTDLTGICVCACAVNDYSEGGPTKRTIFGFSTAISRIVGRFPAKALRQGPSDEPAALMVQFARWARRGAFESFDRGTDYWRVLGDVNLPVLSVIGETDRWHASPNRARKLMDKLGSGDKTLLVCGKSHGFLKDYGHVDLLRGADAAQEILPKIDSWMRIQLQRENSHVRHLA